MAFSEYRSFYFLEFDCCSLLMRLLTNDPAGDGPGGNVNALLHERSQRKPEAVDHAEVVAHLKRQKSKTFNLVSNNVHRDESPE